MCHLPFAIPIHFSHIHQHCFTSVEAAHSWKHWNKLTLWFKGISSYKFFTIIWMFDLHSCSSPQYFEPCCQNTYFHIHSSPSFPAASLPWPSYQKYLKSHSKTPQKFLAVNDVWYLKDYWQLVPRHCSYHTAAPWCVAQRSEN